ncbi:hypothetical protein TSUD_388860 [Trifolium subterraneum]|uniref:BHLH domain-containing protein n=1 Tax=Trifolium subterraneum TaxID=3900 RepID=A0A2Z6M229_TRISU|nr:hypothetical protein TSUD_388860 [Trifolium subterraneum]
MVGKAASQTRFRALKHWNGVEGEPTIIVRVIACFQPLHDCQAHESWPCPQHVAWPSHDLNCDGTLPDPSMCGHSANLNPSTCTFPSVSAFPGFTTLATPSLQTDQTNEVQGFLQDPKAEPCLKETHNIGAMQNENPSLQKKFIIFDRSGNKTRLFYSPIFSLVQSPIVTTTQFTQACDVNLDGQATNFGQKHFPKYSSPEESDQDHVVNEESEMHEDTEEINALLCSDDYDSDDDDDDEEVTSTGHSPLANQMTYLIQEQIKDTKEDAASSDWPNKRHKLIDGRYTRLPPPVDSASSVKQNKPCDSASDAESKYSCGEMYFARQTENDNSAVGDIQLKRDKIRKTLRILENLTPGAKGKHPLLVIEETIDYLKSLMSQSGMLGVKYH